MFSDQVILICTASWSCCFFNLESNFLSTSGINVRKGKLLGFHGPITFIL